MKKIMRKVPGAVRRTVRRRLATGDIVQFLGLDWVYMQTSGGEQLLLRWDGEDVIPHWLYDDEPGELSRTRGRTPAVVGRQRSDGFWYMAVQFPGAASAISAGCRQWLSWADVLAYYHDKATRSQWSASRQAIYSDEAPSILRDLHRRAQRAGVTGLGRSPT